MTILTLRSSRPLLVTVLLVLWAGSLLTRPSLAQETVELWPEGAPGAVGTEDVDRPTLTIYLPDASAAIETGVVVCPGGGYAHLALDHEGRQVAEWLTRRGVAAFVLKYRLGPRYRHPAPLQDVRRALRYVRAHADAFGISPSRIGVWGFSAGGHLAATASTMFAEGEPEAADSLLRVSSRPDFSILAYPVISFTKPFTHEGSRRFLLGENFDPALAESLSVENRVSSKTPPTFLFHTDEDAGVPPENSIAYYLALRKAAVPAELHVYRLGRHGVGLAPDDPVLGTWTARLGDWLSINGFLPKRE